MNVLPKFRIHVRITKVLEVILMATSTDKVYYAVGRGKEIGIYDTWKECKAQTDGFAGAKYRKFYTLEEAKEFVNFWKEYSTPRCESVESKNAMVPEETPDKLCEDSKNSLNEQAIVKEETTSLHHCLSPQRACVQMRTPSPHSTFIEGRVDQSGVDVLALSLRLDSFEKRFDAVLKEVGAITSEIQHLKSDVNKIKERLGSELTYSPRRGKDGLMQTTLSFNTSSYDESTPRPSPSKRKAADSETPDPLYRFSKRRRSRSNSSEANSDSTYDSLSNIEIGTDSFIVDKDDYVAVYTDGCALSNGQGDAKAGIGIWFGDDHPLNLGRAVIGPPTNNTAEIQAARVAMQRAIKAGIKKLKIHTDSEFLINCATKWIYRWKKNGWLAQTGKPVKNRKELEKLDKIALKIKVRWEKVLAHSNIIGNEAADRLAKLGAENYKRCQQRLHQS